MHCTDAGQIVHTLNAFVPTTKQHSVGLPGYIVVKVGVMDRDG